MHFFIKIVQLTDIEYVSMITDNSFIVKYCM